MSNDALIRTAVAVFLLVSKWSSTAQVRLRSFVRYQRSSLRCWKGRCNTDFVTMWYDMIDDCTEPPVYLANKQEKN